MSFRGAVLPVLALVAVTACSTYRDQLGRGQKAFDGDDHDRTLAILRDLERDVTRLSTPEQAQYAYLRGMADYRVGYRPDARHWLSVARAFDEASPGMLPADWKDRMTEALGELNAVVYAEGLAALTTARHEQDPRKADPKKDRPSRTDVKKDEALKTDEPQPPKTDDPARKEEAPLPKKDDLPLPKKEGAK
jgi:hypothetical protein